MMMMVVVVVVVVVVVGGGDDDDDDDDDDDADDHYDASTADDDDDDDDDDDEMMMSLSNYFLLPATGLQAPHVWPKIRLVPGRLVSTRMVDGLCGPREKPRMPNGRHTQSLRKLHRHRYGF